MFLGACNANFTGILSHYSGNSTSIFSGCIFLAATIGPFLSAALFSAFGDLAVRKKSHKTMMGAQFADVEEHILTLHFICQMLVGHNVQMPSPCCQPASSALSQMMMWTVEIGVYLDWFVAGVHRPRPLPCCQPPLLPPPPGTSIHQSRTTLRRKTPLFGTFQVGRNISIKFSKECLEISRIFCRKIQICRHHSSILILDQGLFENSVGLKRWTKKDSFDFFADCLLLLPGERQRQRKYYFGYF